MVNVNGDSNFSNPQSFFVQSTGPTVNSVSPSSGINGSAQITIGGYGFGSSNTINFVQGNSKFQVANQIPSSYSGTTLTFSLSSSGIIPGVYGVQVCSGSNCSNTNAIFTLVSRTNGPYVASASINDGQSGWVLDVQGSGFTTSSTVSLIHNGQTTVLAQSVYGNPSSYQISTALPGDICTQANEDCQDGSFSVQVTNGNSASNTFQIVDTRG